MKTRKIIKPMPRMASAYSRDLFLPEQITLMYPQISRDRIAVFWEEGMLTEHKVYDIKYISLSEVKKLVA